jgi:Ice-binding-like
MRPSRVIVPIAFIAVLVAGTVLVSAESGERGIDASEHLAGDNGHGQFARSQTVSPVVDPTAPPLVSPTISSVRRPKTLPVVNRGTAPVAQGLPAAGFGAVAPVNLGTAGTFAILTSSGITDVHASAIRGNVGASPITGDAIGLTCPEVTGTIYSVNAGGPVSCRVTGPSVLTTAVRDEETAYTDAAGRTSPGFVNLGAGQIGGLTLAPGVYKWTSGVSISADVTLAGGPNDVWIFQIAGTLTQASATRVTLTGGAQARNVFWQSAGAVALGTGAHSEGTILAKTMIALNTGASTNGRLLAQTAVTLQQNRVTNVQ